MNYSHWKVVKNCAENHNANLCRISSKYKPTYSQHWDSTSTQSYHNEMQKYSTYIFPEQTLSSQKISWFWSKTSFHRNNLFSSVLWHESKQLKRSPILSPLRIFSSPLSIVLRFKKHSTVIQYYEWKRWFACHRVWKLLFSWSRATSVMARRSSDGRVTVLGGKKVDNECKHWASMANIFSKKVRSVNRFRDFTIE